MISELIHVAVNLELVSLGAEVVVADFEEPETLSPAFQGAYGVFGTTECKSFYARNDKIH